MINFHLVIMTPTLRVIAKHVKVIDIGIAQI